MSVSGAGGSKKSKWTKSSIPIIFNCKTTIPGRGIEFSELELVKKREVVPKLVRRISG